MSTQKRKRMFPLATLLGGIVMMFILFAGLSTGYCSTVSIRFNAQTLAPSQAATPEPSAPAQTTPPTRRPQPTAQPSAAPARPGGGGSGGGGSGGKVGGVGGAAITGTGARRGGGSGIGRADAASQQPDQSKATASWHVYKWVDLLIGAEPQYVASVHMRTGTMEFSFADSQPRHTDARPAQYQTNFSEDSKRILDFFSKGDALPPGTVLSWPHPDERVPSAAELLHPLIRASEPYFLEVMTVLISD